MFEYTVSGGNVSTRPGRKGRWRLRKQPDEPAVQSAERIARRRFCVAGLGVLGALTRPWLRLHRAGHQRGHKLQRDHDAVLAVDGVVGVDERVGFDLDDRYPPVLVTF